MAVLASEARVLEIGELAYIKQAYRERTTLLSTSSRPLWYWVERDPPVPMQRPDFLDCTPGNFLRCLRDAHAGRYDLIVVYVPLYSPWHPRHGLHSLSSDPWHPWRALTRVFGVSWLRFLRAPVPLVAVDLNDHFGIRRPGFFLLDKAGVVFKRELPVDRWQVLAGSAHPALPTTRVRANPRWQKRLQKLRPIALPPTTIDTSRLWPGEFPDKTADIFFSGATEANSWVRRIGIEALRALGKRGIRVDIPDTRLSREEFYRRMSRAWLAWSPSGFGWECMRTSEAAQCLTVPVVNHPTIERYRPLLHGRHLIQYDVEGDGLARAVEAALADKARLQEMAIAAREHVKTHLTLPALADHIIETGLSLRRPADA